MRVISAETDASRIYLKIGFLDMRSETGRVLLTSSYLPVTGDNYFPLRFCTTFLSQRFLVGSSVLQKDLFDIHPPT